MKSQLCYYQDLIPVSPSLILDEFWRERSDNRPFLGEKGTPNLIRLHLLEETICLLGIPPPQTISTYHALRPRRNTGHAPNPQSPVSFSTIQREVRALSPDISALKRPSPGLL